MSSAGPYLSARPASIAVTGRHSEFGNISGAATLNWKGHPDSNWDATLRRRGIGIKNRPDNHFPHTPGVLVRSDARAAVLNGAPYGVRTRVPDVKGRCPWPLDEGSKLL